ncbi:helix-turn-helix domain-containing protein [Haliea sp. E1-2-M8]|uniref:helix-turn-helix domain-containing protein n=1 Tax=Haliea sp. E1-2-M8 TaxID=3064706 RepID=UPI0027218514|nr:helix-turn-helix domain-containing protein [Haliea sp. E1-2-M8]MDO8861223.1 helix-turn-helix domain-containing protein [Haliea sp. E1-2-M8]
MKQQAQRRVRRGGEQDAPATTSATFAPLVELLLAELESCGQADGLRQPPLTLAGFTSWYLDVVQRLEAHLAGSDNHAPMARGEVELLCRCALSAADLREAILLCEHFARMLHPRAGRIRLEIARGRASFRLDSLRGQASTAGSLVDITGLFAFLQLFQWLLGRELPLRQVRIGPIRRQDVLPFLRLFRAPVLAGGEDYALDFDAAALSLPVVRAPSEFAAFFHSFPCAVFGARAHSVPAQVSALLAAALRHGAPLPSQVQLAADLGLPLSTFRRRLQQGGSNYRSLREAALRNGACAALSQPDRQISDIAASLGFADAGTFRRAFAQWFGMAPGAWREQALAASFKPAE